MDNMIKFPNLIANRFTVKTHWYFLNKTGKHLGPLSKNFDTFTSVVMKIFEIMGWHFLEEKKLWLRLTSCSRLPDATQSVHYTTLWSQCANEWVCFPLCKTWHLSPSPRALKTPLQLRASGTKEPGRPWEFVSPPNTHWAGLARKYLWLFIVINF